MNHETLAELIVASTKDVFSTMLAIDIQAGEAFVEDGRSGPTEGVAALIGLAGDWSGTGSLWCPATVACYISAQMLMAEYAQVDDDVLDAVGEITNMIIGNIKTAIEEELGPMGLSTPTVIYGRNFTTRSLGKNPWTVVPFECQQEKLLVQLFLTQNKDTNPLARTGLADLQKAG